MSCCDALDQVAEARVSWVVSHSPGFPVWVADFLQRVNPRCTITQPQSIAQPKSVAQSAAFAKSDSFAKPGDWKRELPLRGNRRK